MNQGYPPPQGAPQGYPQPGYPQQGPPQQPPKKGMSGCVLALLIVGGLGVILAAVVGIFIWKAAKAITAVAQEGLNAPGSAELRAAGCDAAVVMDMSKISAMFDAGATPGTETVVISCSVAGGKPAPKCDDLAKTYAKAVSNARGNFLLEVQTKGSATPACKKVYGPTGTFLHDER